MRLAKIISSRIQYFIATSIILLAVLISFFFIYDIGLNSRYFIQRDFRNAFLYRQTGNCDGFKSYHLQDADAWFERCVKEKTKDDGFPIKSFKIEEISIDGNKAFLQVELERDAYAVAAALAEKGHKLPEGGYLVTYTMERINGHWFFNQVLDQ